MLLQRKRGWREGFNFFTGTIRKKDKQAARKTSKQKKGLQVRKNKIANKRETHKIQKQGTKRKDSKKKSTKRV